MHEVQVSVIMPVYNVEKYVARAIDSVKAQTLENFELLIVDDGSPDRSGEICEEYAADDARIKVIHKENGGAPSARNAAIELARGKYMYFMDSDDWAEPTMLEDMVALAEGAGAQLVVAGFYIDTYYSDDEYLTIEASLPGRAYSSQREFRESAYALFDKNLLYTPWNKLFLSSYILENGIRFPHTFWDDFPFNLAVLRDVERVVLTDRRYYHFIRARGESETARYRPEMYQKREEEHGWMLDLYRHWQVDDPKSVEMISRRYLERVVGCLENLTNPSCTLPPGEVRGEMKKILKNPNVQASLVSARFKSLTMRAAALPMRLGSASLAYLMCRYISKIKSTDAKRFAYLKANR